MITLVFCLEEPSAKMMLQGVLPRLLCQDITIRYIVFEGKQDLHKQLSNKIRFWQQPNSYFIILRDQDSGNCTNIKLQLQELCKKAGRPDSLVRIACHELESFYLGDLAAIEVGLGLQGLAKQQQSKKFRDPDRLNNAAEELIKLTQKHYQKIDGSRRIGPHLRLDGNNCSTSFKALITGIKQLVLPIVKSYPAEMVCISSTHYEQTDS